MKRAAFSGRKGLVAIPIAGLLCCGLPACGGGGDAREPDWGLLPGRCTPTPPGAGHWRIGGFYHSSRLVDPGANPLVAKVRVGESVSLWLEVVGTYCGPVQPVTWTSTAPAIATVVGTGEFATVTGLGAGETIVYAETYGSRADLFYYCCPPCTSPTPPPSCTRVPIRAIRVVE